MLNGIDPGSWVEHRFPAMGSHAHVLVQGDAEDARWAEHEIARLEQLWSRFLPASDLSRLNAAAGDGPVAVAPETAALVARACLLWHQTRGAFDPTVLRTLEANGYDAPFTEVRERPAPMPVIVSAPPGRTELRIDAVGRRPDATPAPGCAGIVVDHGAATVALPAGVGLDLGGVGKGAAADLVADGLVARGVPSACVSMGGDVRAYSTGPDGEPWPIPVENPFDEHEILFTHPITNGAIVTSTNRFRRWVHQGREQHHLIDPATGWAADTGLAAVIVADRSAARAEAVAKAAFVVGPEAGAALLERHGVTGWFVTEQGQVSLAYASIPELVGATR